MERKLHIDEFKEDIYTCIRSRCGFCFSSCPIFLSKGLETYTSRGKSMVIKAFLEGKIDFSYDLAERFSQCTNCGFCTTNCDVDRPDIFNAFKNDINEAGFRIERHEGIRENIREFDNPYGESGSGEVPEKYLFKSNKDSKVLLYEGCTARYREKDIFVSMMRIMDDFAILERPICCGSVLLRTGNRDDALEQGGRLKDVMDRYDVIVTSCAGCYNMLSKQYPKMGLSLDADVLHSSEYIWKMLKEGKLHLSKIGSGIKATYHDPCHTGRRGGIFEEPRELLSHMGFELVEMPRNRENALCCGAGGGYKSLSNENATNIAAIRCMEASATGADILVTSCPFCVRNLKDGCKGMDIEVVELVNLVAQAKYEPDTI